MYSPLLSWLWSGLARVLTTWNLRFDFSSFNQLPPSMLNGTCTLMRYRRFWWAHQLGMGRVFDKVRHPSLWHYSCKLKSYLSLSKMSTQQIGRVREHAENRSGVHTNRVHFGSYAQYDVLFQLYRYHALYHPVWTYTMRALVSSSVQVSSSHLWRIVVPPLNVSTWQ